MSEANQPNIGSEPSPEPPRYGERVSPAEAKAASTESASTGPEIASTTQSSDAPRYGERTAQPQPVAQPSTPPVAPANSSSGYAPVLPGQPYPGTPAVGQPYGAAPTPGQPMYPVTPPVQRTNTLAIVAFVIALVFSNLIGLILGIVALNQIKKTGEKGRGLAIASIVIGGVLTLLALGLVFWLMAQGISLKTFITNLTNVK